MTIHDAAARGDLGEVERALARGATADAVDARGYTALHHAAAAQSPEVVRALLGAGVPPDTLGNVGVSALFFAVGRSGDAATLEVLLAAGARPDVPGSFHGPLSMAAGLGHTGVVRLLLAAGACPDGGQDPPHSPLWSAAQMGHPEVVRALLEAGADPNKGAPLMFAAAEGNTRIVGALLAAGAHTGVAGPHGIGPLHVAAARGRLPVVRELLSAGADARARDGEGDEPIHHAARHGDRAIVEELLRHGADCSGVGAFGRRPLHVAAERGRSSVCELLLRHGARMGVYDEARYDPPSMARACGHTELAEWLLAQGTPHGNKPLPPDAPGSGMWSEARCGAEAMAAYRTAWDGGDATGLMEAARRALEDLRRDGLLTDQQANAKERTLTFSLETRSPPVATIVNLEFEWAMRVCLCNVTRDADEIAALGGEADHLAKQYALLKEKGL